MKFQGFVGPSYTLDSVNVDSQRTVNLYPEIIESGDGKDGDRVFLRSTPGLKTAISVGSGPIRLVHVDSIGRIFVVSGNQLYTLHYSGGVWSSTLCTAKGEDQTGAAFTFGTSSGQIRARSFSFQGTGADSSTMFVDGTHNYIFYQYSGSLVTVGLSTAAGYGEVAAATDIVWADGSFIVNNGGTNQFYVSDLQSFNFGALTFSSAEGYPDIIQGIEILDRYLWVFNQFTAEIYANTGNGDFPYERIPGGFIEVGALAKRSIAKTNNTLFWLGQSDKGWGQVYVSNGQAAERISTIAMERAIKGYASPSSATAFAYSDCGHDFYVLNFAEATWVYDMSTGMWHERAFTNVSTGALERHRAEYHAYSQLLGFHILGDYTNAKVYIFDDSTYQDDGGTITRLRTFPHLGIDDLARVFCSRLQIDMETGVGLVSGLGSNPQVILTWSDDNGHTWSNEAWTSAGGQVGGIGLYTTRVIWRRLGSFRDRVFKIKITDPVKVVLIDAFIDLKAGGA